MEYFVRKARSRPELQGTWDSPAWREADAAPITHFHTRSSSHHPEATAKLLYDDAGLYLQFRVRDRYVICRNTSPQSPVCKDSCVEAFLQPRPDKGYFNFEMNCGGALLLYYVTDPTRTEKGLRGYQKVASGYLERIRIYHSLPGEVKQEIESPTEWVVEYFVPNEVFEAYLGKMGPAGQRRWRGNFYKCADNSSHPHWGSWAPIGEALNFHVPEYFQSIRFEEVG